MESNLQAATTPPPPPPSAAAPDPVPTQVAVEAAEEKLLDSSKMPYILAVGFILVALVFVVRRRRQRRF
jgi:hypothetical protein